MPFTTRTDAVVSPIWSTTVSPRFSQRAAQLLLAVSLLLAPALAAFAQEGPFQAVVSQDKVDVRSGGSSDFYSVGKLERGARVTVLEIIGGWNLIAPPAGVHAIILKSDVSTADEKAGTVKAEKAVVLALSLKGANKIESYRPWPSLKKGDAVEISGESGDFYIINPPKGSVAYLPPGSVRRTELVTTVVPAAPATPAAPAPPVAAAPIKPAAPARAEPAKPKPPVLAAKPDTTVSDAAAAGALPVTSGSEAVKGDGPAKPEPAAVVMDNTTKPAKPAKPVKPHTTVTNDGPATTQPEKPGTRGAVFVQRIAPSAPAPAAPSDASTGSNAPADPTALGDSPAVRELETKLAAAAKQPVEKRPLAELIAGYEQADAGTDLSPTDRRIVSVRLGQLRDNLAIQKAVQSAEATRKSNSSPITIPPPPAPPKPGVYNPADYDAVGQLLASTVYDGEASPRLLRIADPANQRTIAYVLPGPKLDAQHLLGKIVGVKGEAKYDPALRLRVIVVDKIDLLLVDGTPEPTK